MRKLRAQNCRTTELQKAEIRSQKLAKTRLRFGIWAAAREKCLKSCGTVSPTALLSNPPTHCPGDSATRKVGLVGVAR